MISTLPSPALVRLEAALAVAARRFVDESRQALADTTRQHELVAVLSRLDIPSETVRRLAKGTATAALRAEAETRLKQELARLARASRGRQVGYDLNRHIAVHRALAQLQGTVVTAPAPRASGRELNARFCGSLRRSRSAIAGRRAAAGS